MFNSINPTAVTGPAMAGVLASATLVSPPASAAQKIWPPSRFPQPGLRLRPSQLLCVTLLLSRVRIAQKLRLSGVATWFWQRSGQRRQLSDRFLSTVTTHGVNR